MNTNCVQCVVNPRTGPDLLCDTCRRAERARRSASLRTEEQNNYYWGVVLPAFCQGLSDAWGETYVPARAHEFLKQLLLAEPVYDPRTDKKIGTTDPSTANLTVRAFSEYLEKINRIAAEFLHVTIPPASEKPGMAMPGRPSV